MVWIGLLLVFLIICFYTGTLVMLSKKKFGECIPVALLSMTLIMYYTQFLFGTFKIGYVLIVLIALMLPILIYMSKERHLFRKNYFSVGFWGFIFILGMFCILDYGRYFRAWDELSHWGMMTKEMLRLDDWYTVDASRLLVHKDYPPFLSIFEMLFCKFSGGYSEDRVYIGLHTFMLSFLVPPILDRIYSIKKTTEKSKVYDFCYRVISCAATCIFFVFVIECFDLDKLFNTIYKDIVVASVFSYAILLIICKDVFKEKFYFVALLFATIALPLIKQMGILFVFLIWFCYGCKCLLVLMNKHREKIGLTIGNLIAIILIPLLSQSMWKNYVNKFNVGVQFALGRISIREFVDIAFNHSDNLVQRETFCKFVEAVFKRNIGALPLSISYAQIFLIIVVIILFLVMFKTKVYDKTSVIVWGLTCFCGTLGYAFTMLVLYLFCYSEYEMLILASYDRYMSSFVIGEMLVIASIFLLLVLTEKKLFGLKGLIVLNIILGLGINSNILTIVFTPGSLLERPYQNHLEIAQSLESSIEGEEKVFIISNSTIEMQYFVNYYAEDLRIVLCYANVLDFDANNVETVENIEDKVFTNDYLYVYDMNETFNQSFAKLNGGNNFEANKLYRIAEDKTVSIVD